MTIPSFVSATNLTPTGTLNSAESKAMCSFPVPEAMDRATSVPSNLFFSFSKISFLSWTIDLSVFNSINSKSIPGSAKSFAKEGPSKIIFSHSPFFISPATCPQLPFPVDISATNSMLVLVRLAI